MKNSKRGLPTTAEWRWQAGEIATILTVGTLIVLGVSTLVSSLFLSKNNPQTTSTRAADTAYRGPCVGQPPIESKDTPSGYHWEADCNKQCNDKSACPQNTSDGRVNPTTSNWCYGFDGPNHSTADWRCMQLKWGSSNFSQVPANTATPVPAGGGSTGGQCSPTKINKQNVCDPACCGNNGECPSGQACNIGNGNCNSNLSCGLASSGGGGNNGGGDTGGGGNPTATPAKVVDDRPPADPATGINCEYSDKIICINDSECASCSRVGCKNGTYKCAQKVSPTTPPTKQCMYSTPIDCEPRCSGTCKDCGDGSFKCESTSAGGGSLGNCTITQAGPYQGRTIPNSTKVCINTNRLGSCLNGQLSVKDCQHGCDDELHICKPAPTSASTGGGTAQCAVKTATNKQCVTKKTYNTCQGTNTVSEQCPGNQICENDTCVEPTPTPTPFCNNLQAIAIPDSIGTIGVYDANGNGLDINMSQHVNNLVNSKLRNDLRTIKTTNELRTYLFSNIKQGYYDAGSTILTDLAQKIHNFTWIKIKVAGTEFWIPTPVIIQEIIVKGLAAVFNLQSGIVGTVDTTINSYVDSLISNVCR